MGKPRFTTLGGKHPSARPLFHKVCVELFFHKHEVAMPGLVTKLVIGAAVEGLILHPSGQRNQRSLQIKYTTHELSALPHSKLANSLSSAEFQGVVGNQLPTQLEELP